MLKQGEPARLFPVLSDSSRENRITSVFLALLPIVPQLSQIVFGAASVPLARRAKIACFTENCSGKADQ